MEIRELGGASFERALEHFRRGEVVSYRGMDLVLRRAEFDCRIAAPDPSAEVTPRRALDLLTRARFRLGALLASAPPLADIVGNREPRYLLVAPAVPPAPPRELYEMRGDRLRRLP